MRFRGNRGRVPISPIINLVSVGRRVKRSFIRAEDRCAFIELAIQKCPWCAIPSRPLPSLAVTLREPCVAERIKNTVFSLSFFWFTFTDPGIPLPPFFLFFYIPRKMALLTVSVVSNWTVCHASDNKILAAAARNPFSSPGSARPSFMVNKERSEAWTLPPPVIGPIPSLLSGLPLRNPHARNLPEARFHEGPIPHLWREGRARPQTNS